MLEKTESGLVLVVDDSASVSEFLVERVTGLTGARCLVASSMAQARTILASSAEKPDVAVLDLILPDAPNGEIVEEVLGHGVPAIVLSGADAPDMRDRVLAAGASDYVNKDSYGIDYVARQIRRMLMAKENRILVVDDSRAYRQRIGELLEQHGYSVLYAQDGQEGLDVLNAQPNIRMVITDHDMPRMNGLKMTSAIRRRYSFEELSIIALSGASTTKMLPEFLRSGASDYLHKSCGVEELFCRVDQNIDMLMSLAAARHASHHDYLTGLLNRRRFMELAKEHHTQTTGQALAVAMVDADFFKRVNDEFGHHAGDRVLVELSRCLKNGICDRSLAARMGGEEFALLLPVNTRAEAIGLLEAVRQSVEQASIAVDERPITFTVSIGAVLASQRDIEALLDEADKALYQAKSTGRNRVVLLN